MRLAISLGQSEWQKLTKPTQIVFFFTYAGESFLLGVEMATLELCHVARVSFNETLRMLRRL